MNCFSAGAGSHRPLLLCLLMDYLPFGSNQHMPLSSLTAITNMHNSCETFVFGGFRDESILVRRPRGNTFCLPYAVPPSKVRQIANSRALEIAIRFQAKNVKRFSRSTDSYHFFLPEFSLLLAFSHSFLSLG